MKLILASQSPRRKYLLEKMGLEFETIPSNFVEYFDDSRAVEEIVCELGLGKALDVAKTHPDAVVIGSDLIVVVDGKQVGKPVDAKDAKARLRTLSGKTHQLIASVAVVCMNKNYQKVGFETSYVTFDELDENFIDEYVATGTIYDKASAYAIQHPLVKSHIQKIEGRMDTIVGMPTNLVAKYLNELGIEASEIDLEKAGLLEDKELFE